MITEKQVQRLFALSNSIKLLQKERRDEAEKLSAEFLEELGSTNLKNPIKTLHNKKSDIKLKAIKKLIEEKQDSYNLYKYSYINDKDIISYLGLDKIKKNK